MSTQKKRKSHRELTNHRQLVKKLIKSEPDLIEMLDEKSEWECRTGPVTPDFAEGKHKSIVYLSGYNVVLLKKMVRDELKADPCTKVSKSTIINRMVEYFLDNNTNAKSRKM